MKVMRRVEYVPGFGADDGERRRGDNHAEQQQNDGCVQGARIPTVVGNRQIPCPPTQQQCKTGKSRRQVDIASGGGDG